MSEAKKLSQDNAFVSDLVLRQHVCPSRDNQNDQRQQKRQPTAVDPAEGKLRKITTQLVQHLRDVGPDELLLLGKRIVYPQNAHPQK